MDPNIKPLIAREAIAEKIRETAAQIQSDYADKDLVIVMVMKGAVCLVADLIRELDLPLDLEYVQCSSYGARGTNRGELQVFGLERLNIHNKDVLIVDDIFDSGHTLSTLIHTLQQKGPRSVKSLVLLSKDVPHMTSLRPDYALFTIENLFVVGYGLDYKERYRGLSDVCILENPHF